MKLPPQIAYLVLLLAMVSLGCSRARYRMQADQEVHHLIGSVSQNPRWPLPHYTIEPNPQSRMFDPHNPDRPPMPPDDPAAHELMHCVDCKPGFPCWHMSGDTPFVENPDWKGFVPLDEQGQLKLDIRGAVSTALLNSPNYQRQLEELYLSALDVTFERFRFDTQFFGGYEAFYETIGPDRADGPSNELDLSTRNIAARKMFAGGGSLVVGLANSLIWEFTGSDRHTALTLLDFSLVQPLLRFGGRARVLERLTIAERALLANVRQMERFRRGFYADIVAGVDSGSGPSRRGGLRGGSGLEGFSGVGTGGFGRLGSISGGGRGETGAGQAGGYLGLLQQAQEIRNLRTNVAQLKRTLALLEALHKRPPRPGTSKKEITKFQVDLARQSLYNEQSKLLNRETGFDGLKDSFKIELGLPPDTPVVISDPRLNRFNLIDPDLTATQDFAGQLLNQVRDDEVMFDDDGWSAALAGGVELSQKVHEQIEVASVDIKQFFERLPARRASLRRLAERKQVEGDDVDSTAFDIEHLNASADRAEAFLQAIVDRHEKSLAELQAIEEKKERKKLITVLTQFNDQLGDLLLLQARARVQAAVLEDVDLAPHDALSIASENRLDWMNARGGLVDAWRLVEFNANDLKSDLDIVFRGEIRNVGDNPFKLQGNAGRLQAGLEFDAPLTRLSERNNYRQALIEYQQARRSYYTYVDRVHQGLRGTLRSVELNKLNFEMRRAAVQLAISQVELAGLELQKPLEPGVESAGSDNRVQNYIGALRDLLIAQDDFLSIWVSYQVLRLTLDFNLGTMQLDHEGQWIDPGVIDAETLRQNNAAGEQFEELRLDADEH
ncbi:MAG: hypothetical protein VX988_01975 [Planctomycetota bacterium]|nr:hypothetical protein [Planctomycetota bacterium]